VDTLHYLVRGFSSVVTPSNLLVAFLGSVLGTLTGVLPGFGPTAAIALLIPLTAVLPPEAAIIMMAAIYYGAQYGGSTTSIALNIPGESSSVVTAIDGYQMARQGRAGPALAVAAIGSFIAGTLGLFGLVLVGPVLAELALRFGPPEYFGLLLLALTLVVGLSGKSVAKGLAAAALGATFSLIGVDPATGRPRLTFGWGPLFAGIDLISVIIGLFAISEIMTCIEEGRARVAIGRLGRIWLTRDDFKRALPAILRGTAIGFFPGLLPGLTPTVTSFLAYDAEKRFSRFRREVGRGAIEGVAGPESANNANASAGFIPLLAFGIPGSPPLAVLLGAFMIYGLQPGPLLFSQHPDFVWTIIASMYVGNVVLLVLNLPLVHVWARLTTVPFSIMGPIVLFLSVVGAYSVRNSIFDVWMAIAFGVVGWLMRRYDYPLPPMILSFILAPMVEAQMLQSLRMAAGNLGFLLGRPVALFLVVASVVAIITSLRRQSGRSESEPEMVENK